MTGPVPDAVLAFARAAQRGLVTRSEAVRLAEDAGIPLVGLGGTEDGEIGALGGAGLRADGNDGRFVGLTGIRDVSGPISVAGLIDRTAISHVVDEATGTGLEGGVIIDVGDWVRPRLSTVDRSSSLDTWKEPGSMQTYAPTRAATGRRRQFGDLGLAVAIGLVGALAKKHLDFQLGIPGHAGVGWIAVLISGRLVNRRPGMAAVAGVSMGLWSVPVGLGHSLAYNLALYSSVAALLDLPGLRRLTGSRLFGAMTAGVLVHVAKFVFVLANVWLSGIVRPVEPYGLSSALVNHVVFGAAGGLLGYGLWRTGRMTVARFRPTDRMWHDSW